jgi:hypothetical protein
MRAGLIGSVVGLFGLALAIATVSSTVAQTRQPEGSSTVGRYHLSVGDTGRPYLCDTMTGASWQHDGRAWLSMGTPLGAPHADK